MSDDTASIYVPSPLLDMSVLTSMKIIKLHICMPVRTSDKLLTLFLLLFSYDRTRKSIVQGQIWSLRWMHPLDKQLWCMSTFKCCISATWHLLDMFVSCHFIDTEIQLLHFLLMFYFFYHKQFRRITVFLCFDSNVASGKLFGIPLRGTHSHAFVSSFLVGATFWTTLPALEISETCTVKLLWQFVWPSIFKMIIT